MFKVLKQTPKLVKCELCSQKTDILWKVIHHDRPLNVCLDCNFDIEVRSKESPLPEKGGETYD